MFSKEDVEKLMLKYFPFCPLCKSEKGYDVSGFHKDFVQCKSCGAQWKSSDFIECLVLRNLILWQPAHDGTGASLAKRKVERSIDFWKDPEKVKKELEESKEKPIAPRTLAIGGLFEMEDEEVQSIMKVFLRMSDVGSYPSLADLVHTLGNPEQARVIGLLQTIVCQNCVLIGQNELLHRLLSKQNTAKSSK